MVCETDGKGRFIASVKIGPKGQIVIPKEVREMLEVNPGDTMLLLADKNRGIAIVRYAAFEKTAEAIFSGRAHELESGRDDLSEGDEGNDSD